MYVFWWFYSGYTSQATIGGPECNTQTILPGAHAELYDSTGELILAFYLSLGLWKNPLKHGNCHPFFFFPVINRNLKTCKISSDR